MDARRDFRATLVDANFLLQLLEKKDGAAGFTLERRSKLFALLTLALCWAFRTGQWLHQLKPPQLKKHGRRTKSIFRHGFDHLRGIVLNPDQSTDDFYQVLLLFVLYLGQCIGMVRG